MPQGGLSPGRGQGGFSLREWVEFELDLEDGRGDGGHPGEGAHWERQPGMKVVPPVRQRWGKGPWRPGREDLRGPARQSDLFPVGRREPWGCGREGVPLRAGSALWNLLPGFFGHTDLAWATGQLPLGAREPAAPFPLLASTSPERWASYLVSLRLRLP